MARKESKRYSREFKLEALRLGALGERPKAQIARALGIRVKQLRKWRLAEVAARV
jgi:transposase-like protein